MRMPHYRSCGHQDSTVRSLRYAIGISVAMSAAVVALVTPATAANAAQPNLSFTSGASTAGLDTITTHAGATTARERNRIGAYWTPERMKLAGAMVPEITPCPRTTTRRTTRGRFPRTRRTPEACGHTAGQ